MYFNIYFYLLAEKNPVEQIQCSMEWNISPPYFIKDQFLIIFKFNNFKKKRPLELSCKQRQFKLRRDVDTKLKPKNKIDVLVKINSFKNLQKMPSRTAGNCWGSFCKFLDESILSTTFSKKRT